MLPWQALAIQRKEQANIKLQAAQQGLPSLAPASEALPFTSTESWAQAADRAESPTHNPWDSLIRLLFIISVSLAGPCAW